MKSYHNSAHKQRGSLESLLQTPSLKDSYIIGDELPDPDSSRLWTFENCTLRSVRGPQHRNPADRTQQTLHFKNSTAKGLWIDQATYRVILENSQIQTMGALGSNIVLYTDANSSVDDVRTDRGTSIIHTPSTQYFATLE